LASAGPALHFQPPLPGLSSGSPSRSGAPSAEILHSTVAKGDDDLALRKTDVPLVTSTWNSQSVSPNVLTREPDSST
jgi:hypothetical protein